ncbi:hypothetical protein ACFWJ5_31055 [Streptomyces qaidamensis]
MGRQLTTAADQSVSSGCIYVPDGTLHSFGPNTLVYEIEQTSDIQ